MAATSSDFPSVQSSTYYKELMNEYNQLDRNNISQKDFMTKQWVDIMIQRIISAESIVATEGYASLHPSVKTTLRTYLVNTDKDKKTLVLKPIPGKEHRSKTIVPLEESFDIIQKAHNNTKHGTTEEMEAWIANNKFLVNSMCPEIYRRLCMKCNIPTTEQDIAEQDKAVQMIIDRNRTELMVDDQHTANIPSSPKEVCVQPVLSPDDFSNNICNDEEPGLSLDDLSNNVCDEESSEHVCTLDVLDISNNSDHLYNFLLIYQDKKTKFIQLRPLTANTETEISLELIKIIMDFGPPDCIAVDVDDKTVYKNILTKIKVLADSDIALALHKRENKLIEKVAKNIILWMKDQDCKNWGTGCHVVQWTMNNKPDIDGNTPFSRVFGYKYTGCEYKSQFLLPSYDDSDEDDNVENLGLGDDEEVEGNIGQEEEQINKSDKDAFLITITEDVIKTEVEDPELADIVIAGKIEFDSDEG